MKIKGWAVAGVDQEFNKKILDTLKKAGERFVKETRKKSQRTTFMEWYNKGRSYNSTKNETLYISI